MQNPISLYSAKRRLLLRASATGVLGMFLGGKQAFGHPNHPPQEAAAQAVGHSPRRGLIDLHSHWFSPRTIELLSARSTPPRFTTGADGQLRLQRPGASAEQGFPIGSQWFDIDARIAHLDTWGVRHQLISWPTTMGFDPVLSAAESTPLWRAFNDDLAVLVRRHPTRFSGVATLSSSDIAWSVRELERAHDELGFIGGVLPVNGFASLEGAERFRPLFEVAQRRRSHIYLHTGYAHPTVPGQPPQHQHKDTAAIRGTLDTSWSFASAAITLAFSDFLRPYPDVTVQIAMLGGSGAIALVAEQAALNAERLGIGNVREHFRQIWFDTGAAGRGAQGITLAVRVLGVDRIVFGTDYAPAASVEPVIKEIEHAILTENERERIFGGNARELLAAHGVKLAG
ncbi:MAG: amidohydrolase family protein [Zoogloeaceae bacterium]|jgi:predicted TIM-barrel fold metal-dependent hydrolase|nr:amidohydrolase family protein [Zoogloeaceae bacterium]